MTSDECELIREIAADKTISIDKNAEAILLDDLLDFEVKINPESDAAKNILRCFDGLRVKETRVTDVNATLFNASDSKDDYQYGCRYKFS